MATYFAQRSRNRIQMRMAQPGYGPPAPYPFQRETGPTRQDLRNPGPGRNPKFLEQRRGITDFQQFRPGRSLPGYDPRRVNPHLMKGLKHIGLGVLERNPYVRVARLAFDLAYELNWDNPTGQTHPGQTGYDLAGWTLCCEIGPSQEAYIRVTTGQTTVPNGQPIPGYVMPVCGHGVNCGLSGQVPDGTVGGDIGFQPMVTPANGFYGVRTDHVFFGPRYEPSPGQYRMTVTSKYSRRRTIQSGESPQNDDLRFIEQPGIVQPLPVLTPPYPMWQETFQDRERDPRAPMPHPWYMPPYRQPAISIEIEPKGGGRKQPPHVPPKLGYHDNLPPGPRVRERKPKIDEKKAGRFIFAMYDKTTEAKDIIDILYDNLPDDKKCKGAKDLSSKAYCVWKNLEHLDIDQAIEDLIINHYEDKAWGKFFSYGRRSPFGSQLPGGTKPRVELSQRKQGA